MSSRCRRATLALCLAVCQSLAAAQPLKALGYLAWWLPDGWRNIALSELDRLLFFELKVDASGAVVDRHGWPEQWQDLQTEAERQQVPIDLTLTLFDPATFNALFTSPPAMQRLLKESLELVDSKNVAGIQLDFEIYESASAVAIDRYRGFVKELSQRLHQSSPTKSLSIFFPAGGQSPLYDAGTLDSLDLVMMQSYDSHYRSSKNAGPVAPLFGADVLTWQSAAAAGVLLDVPRDRLIFTFPLYGYEWTVKNSQVRSPAIGQGVVTTFAPISAQLLPSIQTSISQRVQQYGAFHDPVSGSSYYKFKNAKGQWYEGWFEDWWSLGRKFDFLSQERFGGMAFFLLGYDQGQLVHYYLQRRGPKNIDALIQLIQPKLSSGSEIVQ